MIDKQDNQTAALPVKPAAKPRKLVSLLILTISLAAAAVFLYQNKSTELRRGATGPDNLIQNGDFSSIATHSLEVNYGSGWIRGGADGTDADRFSPIMTEAGNKYLYMFSLANNPNWWMRYEQPVNIAQTGNYTLTVKARALLKHGRGVSAILACGQSQCGDLDVNDPVPGSTISFDQSNDWETQTATFNVAAAANYIVRLFTEDGSQAFWDDVSLAPAGGTVGQKIAFASNRDGNKEIYAMNADGSGQTRLTSNPATDSRPSFSPDAQKIAFASDRDGNKEIYAMNADGSGQTRLTSNPATDYWPSFSPDGQKIAFTSDRDGNYEIYAMNVNGSGQTNLTNNPEYDNHPSFSPDGQKIAFASIRDGNLEIYAMNADGTGQTRLTNNPALDGYQDFSPDGQKIAFASDRDGNYEIYAMNADGSGQTRLTSNPATDYWPSFSPDGQKIAFTSDRDGNYEIYAMNVNGSGQTRLTNNPAGDYWPAFSGTGGGLIQNGDFSSIATHPLEVNYGSGWIRGGADGTDADRFSPIMTEDEAGNKYLYMFSLANNPNWWMRYEQPVNIAQTGNYTLTVKARALLKHGRGVSAILACGQSQCGDLDVNDPVPGSTISFDQSNDWETQTATFNVAAAANYIVRLFTEDGSQAFWDDVSLVQVISPTPTATVAPTPILTLTPTATPTAPACLSDGQICAIDNDCCSSYCGVGECPPGQECLDSLVCLPSGRLSFKIRLQGIIAAANDRLIHIDLKQGNLEFIIPLDIEFQTDAAGVYSATIDRLDEMVPGTYDILFKGPSHLRKKFTDIEYAGAAAVFDFSQNADDELWAGDVTGDNVINLLDFDAVLDNYIFPEAPAGDDEPTDINADGKISINDVALSLLHIDIASWVEGDN